LCRKNGYYEIQRASKNNMLKILNGKVVRDKMIEELKGKVANFLVVPTLAIIQVGNLPESNKYIKNKISFAEKIGVKVNLVNFPSDVEESDVMKKISELNHDSAIGGIIVQLPLPAEINTQDVISTISPEKDVDGLTAGSKFTPATARAILSLLDFYEIPIAEKKVVIMGRSNLVGRPTARLFQDRGAKVTVVHSQTENPREVTRSAEILVVAIGKPGLVDESYLSPGQIVVDVGITLNGGKVIGDVNFDQAKNIVSAISPVPGGVGPLTVASLFLNLVEACENMV
jgi:methylenetetrahydrofolate dehydrogenase (NADP+)/methenyltetrahydrofolate cyclohydrolase